MAGLDPNCAYPPILLLLSVSGLSFAIDVSAVRPYASRSFNASQIVKDLKGIKAIAFSRADQLSREQTARDPRPAQPGAGHA